MGGGGREEVYAMLKGGTSFEVVLTWALGVLAMLKGGRAKDSTFILS